MAPVGLLVKLVAFTVAPGQTVIGPGTVTDGSGLTVKEAEAGVVPHSLVTDRLIVFVPILEKVVEGGEADVEVNPAGLLDQE